jgi:hypothetical protein
MNLQDYSKVVDAKNRAVVIIGDSHIPYEHCDYLSFIKSVKKKYSGQKPLMIHIGDEIDHHAISFHDNDPELLSAGHELELSIERLTYWNEEFPKLLLLESNHGSLAFRKCKHNGMPVRMLKPLQELYNTPGWSWWHDILLETSAGPIYLCHGKSTGYGALAKEQGCSAIQGHFHGKLEVTWHHRIGHKRFNMFVGCGINWQSLAFAYGKNHVPRPLLGCGVIDKNGMPHVYHMQLNEKGRWTKRI